MCSGAGMPVCLHEYLVCPYRIPDDEGLLKIQDRHAVSIREDGIVRIVMPLLGPSGQTRDSESL